jgi:transposase
MDGHGFEKWIVNNLIPAFKAMYGEDKKMILVLDNAPYHHVSDHQFQNISSMSKKQLAAKLKEFRVTTFAERGEATAGPEGTVVFSQVDWPQTTWEDNYPRGPKREVLQKVLKGLLSTNPRLLDTKLMKSFREKGWGLVFTPPYKPAFQPIELVWSQAKGYVARTYTNARTSMIDLRDDTIKGFRGNSGDSEEVRNWTGITKGAVEKLINRAHHHMGLYIKADVLLTGEDIHSVERALEGGIVPEVVGEVDELVGDAPDGQENGEDFVGDESDLESNDEEGEEGEADE